MLYVIQEKFNTIIYFTNEQAMYNWHVCVQYDIMRVKLHRIKRGICNEEKTKEQVK